MQRNLQLRYQNHKYIFECDYDTRFLPKGAGFSWDAKSKTWQTTVYSNALHLAEYADEECKEKLAKEKKFRAISHKLSRLENLDIEIPAPDGSEYLPFQKVGIAYAMSRPNKATLIADQMGLGKTIQAVGFINLLQHKQPDSRKKILVVCPASLKLVWQREIDKWLVPNMTVGVVWPSEPIPKTDILIVNYELLYKRGNTKLIPEFAEKFDVLVVDECHYIKNSKSIRTRMVNKLRATWRLFLTGTPILNRPKELWNLLKNLDPKNWGSQEYWFFHKRYCNAIETPWGWNFDGASNLEELQQTLRETIMVRRLKSDVLKELPPKVKQVIPIDGSEFRSLVKRERKIEKEYEAAKKALTKQMKLFKDNEEAHRENIQKLREASGIHFGELAKVRKEIAEKKIPYVIEFVDNMLEQTDKIVIMAWHHVLMDALYERYKDIAVLFTGKSSAEEKTNAEQSFQNNPDCKIFIGSMKAAGVGLTLTAASEMVFAEQDWTPGVIAQAEDRIHRITQEDTAFIYYIVVNDSIDARMAKTVIKKQKIIDEALDTRHDG